MPTVLLVRHGRSTANVAGVLAGWTPGVALDDTGWNQAHALAARMAALPLTAVVSSPLERCASTASALVAVPGPAKSARPDPVVDERLGECRYGDWTGRELRTLTKDPLWRVVQAHPSGATFPGPGGESMREMQHRAVECVRDWDARIEERHGPDAVWVAVSHGDVLKSVLADALGMHLDVFQRIVLDPCSVSAVRYTPTRPFVLRMNDTGGDLSGLRPRSRRRPRRAGARALRHDPGDAVVGGSTGT